MKPFVFRDLSAGWIAVGVALFVGLLGYSFTGLSYELLALPVYPLLAVFCLGLVGVRVGLEQTEQFRVEAESVDGFETLNEHFPAGLSNPTVVLARTELSLLTTPEDDDVIDPIGGGPEVLDRSTEQLLPAIAGTVGLFRRVCEL